MDDNHFIIRKGYTTVSKTFRLPVDLCEKLEKLAEENHISMNALILQCITYALEHLHKT